MAENFSADELALYEREGYLLVRNLFSSDEMQTLLDFARADQQLAAGAYERRDGSGGRSKLALWNQAGDDLYGLFARSPRIVDRMRSYKARSTTGTPR